MSKFISNELKQFLTSEYNRDKNNCGYFHIWVENHLQIDIELEEWFLYHPDRLAYINDYKIAFKPLHYSLFPTINNYNFKIVFTWKNWFII